MSVSTVTSLVDYILTLASPKLLLISKDKSMHFKEYFTDAKGNYWCLVHMLKLNLY